SFCDMACSLSSVPPASIRCWQGGRTAGPFHYRTSPNNRYEWAGAHKGPAFFAYSDNYLIDVKFGVIVDVEASRAIRQEEQAWPLPGERLKAVADRQKITPSGSKCRVPAAPVTGPLKSPARRDLAGPTPSKCE